MFCCCAEETEEATLVTVPAVAVLEEVEKPAAVEKAAAVDAPSVKVPSAPTTVPAPPPEVEEPQGPQEFQVVLERVAHKSSYGWAIDMLNADALYIESLAGDASMPVATYNKTAPAGKDIRAGDYITRVGGASGRAKELSESLCNGLRTQVTIQRPAKYVVELSKGGRPLGVELNHTNTGKNLCIVKIRDGVIREQAPEVGQGHRILSVNGKDVSSKDMIEALKGSSLKLSILRGPVV